ncbi:MAG: hypothetical protein HY865_20845 [Chloroflexi bacterium]|nr:hypothetical protein [Chloroflexota bacterium]
MNNHPQKTMDNCVVLEHSEQMGSRVHLRKVFDAFNNRQVEFNWLITDFECASYPPEFQSQVGRPRALWFSGRELTRIIEQNDIQFVWAVLSGFPQHVTLDPNHLEVEPYANGNKSIWVVDANIQHPLAEIELVCWDASVILLRTRDADLTRRFNGFFAEAVFLDKYNQMKMQNADGGMDNVPSRRYRIQCADCKKVFIWQQAYWQSRTPGSQDAAGYDYVCRAFCPHCGAIVCDGTISNWKWHGENQLLNAYKELPPTLPPDLEWLPDDERGVEFMKEFHEKWGKRQLPNNLWVPVSKHHLDLSVVGDFKEIPFQASKARPLKAFLAELWKSLVQPRTSTRRSPADSVASAANPPNDGGEIKTREAYFHEDDYCQIEILPASNWDYCLSQLQKIGKFSAEHFDGLGWTDMQLRGESPQQMKSLNINAKDLTSSLSQILVPFDRVLTGYSSLREEAEDTMAFGSETSGIIFVEYDSNDIVEAIWLDFGIASREDKQLALTVLQHLGRMSELILVDWHLGKIIKLSDHEELMSYFAL